MTMNRPWIRSGGASGISIRWTVPAVADPTRDMIRCWTSGDRYDVGGRCHHLKLASAQHHQHGG